MDDQRGGLPPETWPLVLIIVILVIFAKLITWLLTI